MAAGHLALELVNTVSWRHDPARFVDRLGDPAAVAAFTRRHGLPEVTDVTPADVARLRALREIIHDAAVERSAAAAASVTGAGGGAVATAALRDAAAAAVGRAALDLDAAGGPWIADPSTPQGLHDHLVLAAVDLLATADPARLRACADDDCGWVFYDRSRSGTRRWCDARDCGNRARVRRHRQRSTA